jgi:hypothetical protein
MSEITETTEELEIWKDIPGLGKYRVSSFGNVYNKKLDRISQTECVKHEYIRISISLDNGDKITAAIHRLVALAFHENTDPLNKTQVHHKDTNKRNNRANNLEWITQSDNQIEALDYRTPGGPKIPVCVEYDGFEELFESYVAAEKKLGIKSGIISYSFRFNDGEYDKYTFKHIKNDFEDQFNQGKIKEVELDGYTHLYASSDGYVYNKNTKIKLIGSKDCEYIKIKSTKKTSTYLHRIIAHTFVEIPERFINTLLEDIEINHINGEKSCNKADNLEWCTHAENIEHARKTGLMSKEHQQTISDKLKKKIFKLELDGTIICEYKSVDDVELEKGAMEGAIRQVCLDYKNKKYRSLNGYGYCYAVNYEVENPIINSDFKEMFPDLVGKQIDNYDIIRQCLLSKNKSKPFWQLEISGKRIKLWKTVKDVCDEIGAKFTNISDALNNGKLSHGYFWEFCTGEDIIDPSRINIQKTPKYCEKALNVPEGRLIKQSVGDILKESIDEKHAITFSTRPVAQLDVSNAKFIKKSPKESEEDDKERKRKYKETLPVLKIFPNVTIAEKEVYDGKRGSVAECIKGNYNISNKKDEDDKIIETYSWRYLTDEEMFE